MDFTKKINYVHNVSIPVKNVLSLIVFLVKIIYLGKIKQVVIVQMDILIIIHFVKVC